MLASMSRTLPIFIVLSLFIARPLIAQEPCLHVALHKVAGQVQAVQARLMKVKADGFGSDGVSPRTRADIHALKTGIDSVVDGAMTCESELQGDDTHFTKRLQGRLENLLKIKEQKPRKTLDYDKVPKEVDGVYASDLEVKVKTLSNAPFIVAVQVSFDVDCGEDNILAIYERKNGEWQRSLLWQSGDYDEISGAFGDFLEYRLIPNGGPNGWALAVAHGHPWCSSDLSAFDVDVLGPVRGSSSPTVLFHANEGYRRFDPQPEMRQTPDGFALRLDINTIETGVLFRLAIYRYRVQGGTVERVQPIANNGRDFVDGWLQSPWVDAAKWSSQDSIASLQMEHKRFADSRKPDDSPMLSYGPVTRCSDSKAHFQMELVAERWDGKAAHPLPSTYFQIQQGANSFTMLSASETPDPHCGGGDLMASH